VQGQRQLSIGETPSVAGNDHPVICPYGTFQAADGPFNMAAATDEMWGHLCRLVGLDELIEHPDFRTNSLRASRRGEVRRRLEERFATRGKMQWTQALVALGVPAGPILDLQQVFSDPHVRQTGMIEEIEHPTLGKLEQLANPIRMEGLGGRSVRRAPPLLGQDSEQVLADFGIAPQRIRDLLEAGVVRLPVNKDA
jgi:crotonobetainyl-CoA:carnitine CoA-transferase CaiB-like acyl-CoA transferase